MTKITLIKGNSQENKFARELLDNNQVKYRLVFSDSEDRPSLLVEGQAFPYKGLRQIESYVNSIKE